MMNLCRYTVCIPVTLVVIALIATLALVLESPSQLPCDYYDTVNITDGEKLPNSSILHNNILYESHEFSEIEYIKTKNGDSETVAPHIRGCICNKHNKPCVRLCETTYEQIKNDSFFKNDEVKIAKLFEHHVHDENNVPHLVRLGERFHFLSEQTCGPRFELLDFDLKHVNIIILI